MFNHAMLWILLVCQLSQTDQNRALEIHNNARQAVGVTPLSWSEQLASEAQSYANELARKGIFEHSNSNDGENLFWHSASLTTPCSDASQRWYEEINDYHHGQNWARNFSEVGHYSQMVWSDTKELGIGVAVAKDGTTYVVARYHPAGNYTNEMPY